MSPPPSARYMLLGLKASAVTASVGVESLWKSGFQSPCLSALSIHLICTPFSLVTTSREPSGLSARALGLVGSLISSPICLPILGFPWPYVLAFDRRIL